MRYPLSAGAAAAALLTLLIVSADNRPAAAAQDSSALINEALDKPVEVDLNTALPQALQEIKEQTGVPIELAPGVP